mmetsp:Transcript_19205/g.28669  ORF Transcript_19205/g.28669 Transcript_19205/m.28669 type:complete len:308 (-) Transcript_19205:96-1019(-)
MLGDRVSLNLNNLSSSNLITGTVTDGLLVLLDGGSVHNGSSSNSNVVILGEDPSVEIGGNIISNIHLCHLFVEVHLLLSDLNTLLESNSEVVFTGVHGLGNTRVGSIGSNNKINIHSLGNTSGTSSSELLVVKSVLALSLLVVLRDIDFGNQSLDGLSSVGDGTVPQVFIQDFTTAHTNVFVGLKGVSDINFDIGGGDKLHLTNLTINSRLRNIELPNHTKRNSSTARLGIVHLPLNKNSINSLLLGKDLCSTGTGRASTNNSNLVSHVHGGSIGGSAESSAGKGRGREGGGGAKDEGCNSKLHFEL